MVTMAPKENDTIVFSTEWPTTDFSKRASTKKISGLNADNQMVTMAPKKNVSSSLKQNVFAGNEPVPTTSHYLRMVNEMTSNDSPKQNVTTSKYNVVTESMQLMTSNDLCLITLIISAIVLFLIVIAFILCAIHRCNKHYCQNNMPI